MGWNNRCGKGNAEDTITSGLEGAWTADADAVVHDVPANLYAYEWEQTKSPAGATSGAKERRPRRHRARCAREGLRHQPIMFTTDLALKADPATARSPSAS
jgi:catalase-peroxidase